MSIQASLLGFSNTTAFETHQSNASDSTESTNLISSSIGILGTTMFYIASTITSKLGKQCIKEAKKFTKRKIKKAFCKHTEVDVKPYVKALKAHLLPGLKKVSKNAAKAAILGATIGSGVNLAMGGKDLDVLAITGGTIVGTLEGFDSSKKYITDHGLNKLPLLPLVKNAAFEIFTGAAIKVSLDVLIASVFTAIYKCF